MRELGREVVLHRGRWWVRVVPGFYQPVHLLARMRPDEATRPTLRCWGLRASLAPEFAASANGSIPAHVLPDPRGYDAGRLAPSQRRKLRKHLPEFDLVALDRPDILLEQGYTRSCGRRTRATGAFRCPDGGSSSGGPPPT